MTGAWLGIRDIMQQCICYRTHALPETEKKRKLMVSENIHINFLSISISRNEDCWYMVKLLYHAEW